MKNKSGTTFLLRKKISCKKNFRFWLEFGLFTCVAKFARWFFKIFLTSNIAFELGGAANNQTLLQK